MMNLRQMHRAPTGAGEDAALWVALLAEEFRLQQILWQSAALDGLERRLAAAARIMRGAGNELLAYSKFALQEDGAVVVRHVLDGGEDFADGVALPDDLGGLGRSNSA